MSESNLYELAKRQIELEFQAETQDARERRRVKLETLEQLRPTLEKASVSSPNAVQREVQTATAATIPVTHRIENELKTYGDQNITMPDIYARLLSKYEDVPGMKPANVRSLIATILKKKKDKGEITLLKKGKSNQPNIYVLSETGESVRNDLASIDTETSSNGNFVLRGAVREVVRDFNGKKFYFKLLLSELKKRYPEEIDKKREPSVSATVAALVKQKELKKAGSNKGKAIYQASENGGLM